MFGACRKFKLAHFKSLRFLKRFSSVYEGNKLNDFVCGREWFRSWQIPVPTVGGQDLLTEKLRECSEHEDLWRTLLENRASVTPAHLDLLTLLLWNRYCQTLDFYSLLDLKMPSLQEGLQLILEKQQYLSSDTVTRLLMTITTMKSLPQKEVQRLTEYMMQKRDSLSVDELMRLSVSIGQNRSSRRDPVLIQTISDRLECCSTVSQLEMLSTCIRFLLDDCPKSTCANFLEKTSEFLKNSLFSQADVLHLMKILTLTDKMLISTIDNQWNDRIKSSLVIDLLEALSSRCHKLTPLDLRKCYDILISYREPYPLMDEVRRVSDDYADKIDILPPLTDLLPMLSRSVVIRNKGKIVELYRTAEGAAHPRILYRLFYSSFSLHGIHRSIDSVLKAFLPKFIGFFQEELLPLKLLSRCVNTYLSQGTRAEKSRPEVKKLGRELAAHIKEDVLAHQEVKPHLFMFLFWVQAGRLEESEMQLLMESLQSIGNKKADLYELDRTIRVLNDIMSVHGVTWVNPKQYRQLHQHAVSNLDSAVKMDKDLHSWLVTLRCYLRLKQPVDSDTFTSLLSELEQLRHEMNSYAAGTIANVLCQYRFSCTSIQTMLHDLVWNRSGQLAPYDIVMIMSYLYLTGFMPLDSEPFVKACTSCLLRWQGSLKLSSFLQAVLTVGFFGHISDKLMKQVFHLGFLYHLEHSSFRRFSGDHLRNLNRLICLEFPEYEVPWFMGHKEPRRPVRSIPHTTFRSIQENLLSLRGEGLEEVTPNAVAPYEVPMQFRCMSSRGELAVMVYGDEDYCRGEGNLTGPRLLDAKHLEMLEYKVVHINANTYKQMNNFDRRKYLKSALGIL